MKEMYRYLCENCTHVRMLDNPDQSTICQQCKEPYKVSGAIILHEAHNMINFYGVITKQEDHFLEMDVFEVTEWHMDNTISDPELYLQAHIKWDGCSHVTFADEGYIHLCGKVYWKRHSEIMLKIYEYASKTIKNFDKDEK